MQFANLRIKAATLSLAALGLLSHTLVAQEEFVTDPVENEVPAITDEVLLNRYESSIVPLLQANCYDCHSGENAEAGVDLTIYKSIEAIRESQSVWEQIRGLVRIGAMPPPDSGYAPEEAAREEIAGWVFDALHYVDCSECKSPAPVTVRRLNSVEYDHAIRDLFGVDFETSRAVGFVTDEVGNGFDNQGEVLTLNPLAIEKYMDAARYVADKAITVDRESLRRQNKSGTSIERGQKFDTVFDWAEGKYEISARIEFGFNQDFSVDAELLIDGEVIEMFEVPPRRKSFDWVRELTEGEHTITIRFVDNEKIGGQGGTRRQMRIDSLTVKGPEGGLPRYPVEHRSVVIATPNDDVTVEQAANEIAKNFLTKAYRRPPAEDSVATIVKQIVDSVESGNSFETAVQHGLEIALVAPEFFFRLERSSGLPANEERFNADVEYVDAYDLASRLSFFIWSSIPDDQLLSLAADGSLLKSEIIEQQVDRMIDDPRAESGIVRQFFGQWLGLRNLSTVQVDDDRFPTFNDSLRTAMVRETELFCVDVLRNGKLLDVLSADYSYINPRLAEFYGLMYDGNDPATMYLGRTRGREGRQRAALYASENEFVKTALDPNRRGLLTHASILTLTSNPTRTSPVKRGKWVLENIIGDPPPAAPPGVPSLEQSAEGKEDLTLREQLELHRANPSCASCHKVMDPIGLGLENFNAVGQFREKDGELDIDANGVLADGRQFKGSGELLEHLLSDKEKFARHFTSKLLTFALGRGLVRQDSCAIDEVLRLSVDSDYEFRTLVKMVALSDVFRFRTRLETSED